MTWKRRPWQSSWQWSSSGLWNAQHVQAKAAWKRPIKSGSLETSLNFLVTPLMGSVQSMFVEVRHFIFLKIIYFIKNKFYFWGHTSSLFLYQSLCLFSCLFSFSISHSLTSWTKFSVYIIFSSNCFLQQRTKNLNPVGIGTEFSPCEEHNLSSIWEWFQAMQIKWVSDAAGWLP